MGVVVKMSNSQPKLNCSVSVSVICDYNGVEVRAFFLAFLFLKYIFHALLINSLPMLSMFCFSGPSDAWKSWNMWLCECLHWGITSILSIELALCAILLVKLYIFGFLSLFTGTGTYIDWKVKKKKHYGFSCIVNWKWPDTFFPPVIFFSFILLCIQHVDS